MRYLFGFLAVCALVGTLPQSVSAQAGEEVPAAEPNLEEPAPPSEPAPEEPMLQLKLDDAGVEVVPSPPPTFGGYTLEELELRKRRAAFGLIAPAAVTVAGVVPLVRGMRGNCYDEFYGQIVDNDPCRRLRTAGLVLSISGTVGMIVGLSLLGVRAGALRRAKRVHTSEEPALKLDADATGVSLPLSASAQDAEEGTTSEPSLQEPAAPSELAPEERVRGVQRWHPEAYVDPSKPAAEPALQLELDAAGVEVTPKTAPLTAAEEERLRKRRVRMGVGITVAVLVVGTALGVGLLFTKWEFD